MRGTRADAAGEKGGDSSPSQSPEWSSECSNVQLLGVRLTVRGTSPRLRGVSVRGSLPAWDICWGGSSGPFLSARIAYLQEQTWKVGHEVVYVRYTRYHSRRF